MRTFHDAKAMAKSLRERLAAKDIALNHSECLELVAAEFGFDNWNMLAARIDGSGAVQFTHCAPIIRIFDTVKAKEFYLDFLGFTRDWDDAGEWENPARSAPLYSSVSRAGQHLHLTEHHGDASPGGNAFITMHGIREFHAELIEKQYRYNKPGLETVDWGLMVTVSDPFGNKLRFCEYKAAVAKRLGLE
ncbi:MAG: VOC family protein [Alphaproteobacteria bacterium]|nr:VOC family protein [Alphaproteobacteria bacterium]MBL6936825.1 VOC family protein [Alphaproteobacteria bacterium]MBL7097594.1 VOC family protein [Alphaproteobacteria bacterium]